MLAKLGIFPNQRDTCLTSQHTVYKSWKYNNDVGCDLQKEIVYLFWGRIPAKWLRMGLVGYKSALILRVSTRMNLLLIVAKVDNNATQPPHAYSLLRILIVSLICGTMIRSLHEARFVNHGPDRRLVK